MRDFNVTAVYVDANGEVQQELFVLTCKSVEIARAHVKKVIASEGGRVTVLKISR